MCYIPHIKGYYIIRKNKRKDRNGSFPKVHEILILDVLVLYFSFIQINNVYLLFYEYLSLVL